MQSSIVTHPDRPVLNRTISATREAAGSCSLTARPTADFHPRDSEACSAGSVWRLASCDLAEDLVPGEDRRAIERAMLPLPAFTAMGVERTLGGGSPRIDYVLCTAPADGGPAILAGGDPRWRLPVSWLQIPAWRNVQAFSRLWTEAGSLLERQIQSAWLEFDRPRLASDPPVPCFFINCRKTEPSCRAAVLKTMMRTFVPPAEQADVEGSLGNVLRQLPDRASVDFFGVMGSRTPAAVRLCLGLPTCELESLLSRFGRRIPEPTGVIQRLAARHAPTVTLHLDLGRELGKTVGVEIKPVGPQGWASLLSDLVKEDLCTPPERDAVLGFAARSGIGRTSGRPSTGSDFSSPSIAQWRDVGAFLHRRWPNHIKLVCGPDAKPRAKIYLQIGYRWKPRRPTPGEPLRPDAF